MRYNSQLKLVSKQTITGIATLLMKLVLVASWQIKDSDYLLFGL